MGGGYLSCGTFHGGDKSGSSFEAVLLAVADSLEGPARVEFDAMVLHPIQAALEEPEDYVILEQPLVEALVSPLRSYHAVLGETLGYPEPSEAPAMDERAGLDPIDAKWGSGQGWRYYCASDLLTACELCISTGEPIIFNFD